MTWEPKDWQHTHAHTHDPDTSHDAAWQAKGLAARHKHIIATVLLYWGPLTSTGIAGHCELDYLQVARRIKDLKDDGKVTDTGQRRASPGGRRASVWRLT